MTEQRLAQQKISQRLRRCGEESGYALAIMKARGMNYLPVVDRQQRLVGIVSHDELISRPVEKADAIHSSPRSPGTA